MYARATKVNYCLSICLSYAASATGYEEFYAKAWFHSAPWQGYSFIISYQISLREKKRIILACNLPLLIFWFRLKFAADEWSKRCLGLWNKASVLGVLAVCVFCATTASDIRWICAGRPKQFKPCFNVRPFRIPLMIRPALSCNEKGAPVECRVVERKRVDWTSSRRNQPPLSMPDEGFCTALYRLLRWKSGNIHETEEKRRWTNLLHGLQETHRQEEQLADCTWYNLHQRTFSHELPVSRVSRISAVN